VLKLPATRAARNLYLFAVVVLIVVGAAVRAWGVLYDPLDLWADEAWWAALLESRSLGDLGFRPVGYMWICRQLAELGSAEVMLRLPSLVAGVGALFFIWRSGELGYRGRAAALFVLLLAVFHPKLIVFAKEFKPYSVEIFIYAALTCWAMACLRRGRATAAFVTASAIAIPFCYPVVFLYPGFALAFAGEKLAAVRRWSMRRRVYAALLVIPALLLLHAFMFERLGAAQSRWFWGSKYDVFPIDTGVLDGIGWYARKTWDLLSLPGAQGAIPALAGALFALACIGGLIALARQKRNRELALLGSPLVVVALANILGYWPYGAFRANLFLLPGLLLIGGHALDWMAGQARLRIASSVLVAAAFVAVCMVDPRSYGSKSIAHWAPSPQLTAVLDEIERRRRAGPGETIDVILADWHSWRPIQYYLRDYPDLRANARLVRGPLADAAELERQIAGEVEASESVPRPTRLWLVITRLEPHRAVESARQVRELTVHRREFPTRDEHYHPVLLELHPRPLIAR
jgi:hypothetical protein